MTAVDETSELAYTVCRNKQALSACPNTMRLTICWVLGEGQLVSVKESHMLARILKTIRWLAVGFSILGLLVFGPKGDVAGAMLFTVPAFVAIWASRDWQKSSKLSGSTGFVILLCAVAVFSQMPQGKTAYTAEQSEGKQEAATEQKQQQLMALEQAHQQKLIVAHNAKEQVSQQAQSNKGKAEDAANAMDEQNSYSARINNEPPPPKIGVACGPPAKTNADGTVLISARRLYYDYVTNGNAASGKYQFHHLKVTGMVLGAEHGSDGIDWIALVSGNTWVDNDVRTQKCVVCYFSQSASKAVLHQIEALNEKSSVQVIVSMACTCECNAPTVDDPVITLECSSIKIEHVNSVEPDE